MQGAVQLHLGPAQPAQKPAKRTRRKKSKAGRIPSDISAEEIASWFHLPSEEACVKLGVSLTVLKRICRKHGIERWPFRKLKSLSHRLPAASGSTQNVPALSSGWATTAPASLATASTTTLDGGHAARSNAGVSTASAFAPLHAFHPPQQQHLSYHVHGGGGGLPQHGSSVRLNEVQSAAPATCPSLLLAARAPAATAGAGALDTAAGATLSSTPAPVPSGLKRVTSDTTSGLDILLSAALEHDQQERVCPGAGSGDSGTSHQSPADALAETADATLMAQMVTPEGLPFGGAGALLDPNGAAATNARLLTKQRLLAERAVVLGSQKQRQEAEQAAAAAAAAAQRAHSAPPRSPNSPNSPHSPSSSGQQHQQQQRCLPPAESAPCSPRLEPDGACAKAEELSLTPPWMAAAAVAAAATQGGPAPVARKQQEGGGESGADAVTMDRLPTLGWDAQMHRDPSPSRPTTSDFSFGAKAGQLAPGPLPIQAAPGAQDAWQQREAPAKRSAAEAELSGAMRMLEAMTQPEKRVRLDAPQPGAASEAAALQLLLQQQAPALQGEANKLQLLLGQLTWKLEQQRRAQEQEQLLRQMQQQLLQNQLLEFMRAAQAAPGPVGPQQQAPPQGLPAPLAEQALREYAQRLGFNIPALQLNQLTTGHQEQQLA